MASPRAASNLSAAVFRSARRARTPGAALLLLALLAGPASGEISLRFTPADTTLLAGDALAVAVVVDQPLALRTVDLTVTYRPGVLTGVGGEPGSLFAGVNVWQDFTDDPPGQWNGVVVGMGPDQYVTGPGELYVWHCTAGSLGVAGISAVAVELYAPDGELITEEIRLDRARVQVTDEHLTPVPPPVAAAPALELYPNPFNPRVRLEATRLAPGPARLEVYDLRGRLADVAWRGVVDGGAVTVDWSASGAAGGPLPSGAYLFVLRDSRGAAARARGILLK